MYVVEVEYFDGEKLTLPTRSLYTQNLVKAVKFIDSLRSETTWLNWDCPTAAYIYEVDMMEDMSLMDLNTCEFDSIYLDDDTRYLIAEHVLGQQRWRN